MNAGAQRTLALSWLLLIHQIPAKPAYLRVKIWRRLQGMGAVAVKNAVHALPMSEGTQEDFEWLLREIVEGGGEAFLCETRLIDGLTDGDVHKLFDEARDFDYADVTKELRSLIKSLRPKHKPDAVNELRAQAMRLRKRLADIASIDFFGAIGRVNAESLLAELEARLTEDGPVAKRATASSETGALGTLRSKTWVTRQGVHVDRIASAWLIRRFIDPDARFKFVMGKDYRPHEGEQRFDMFQAEFTHEGDKCTFEVLLDRVAKNDTALRAIAEIIHDIDLKDNKFERDEAVGIRTLIDGIALATTDDAERLARGAEVFNNLYEVFAKKRR
jgi:hypothetical protein